MLEGQLGILSGMIGAYVADGIVPGPLGTAYGALLPYQTFRTRTRDIAIGVGSDKLWRTFCPLLGLEALTDDPRYVTNAARNANRASLVAALQEAFLTQDLRGVGSDPAARPACRWARSTRWTLRSRIRRSRRAARSSRAPIRSRAR